jgi:PiT family inorganic phosphate transporter
MLSLLIVVIISALVFDFINGFHDTANAIATSVSTGVLTVRSGVLMAGMCNFIGAVVGTAVAGFIANKLVAEAGVVTQQVVLAALIGASAWNLITWWLGIPSSSSHALVGGLAGAVVAHAGVDAFQWHALVQKVLVPLVLSPLLGFAMSFALMVASMWLFRRAKPNTVHVTSRYLQLASGATLSFSHGSNDAQKAMGIITLAISAWLASQGITPLLTVPHGAADRPAIIAEAVRRSHLDLGADVDGDLEAFTHAAEAAHRRQIEASTLPQVLKDHQGWILPSAHLERAGSGSWNQATDVPTWIVVACALAMAFGTMAGGKKIIKTMGSKIIKISPLQGFAAQTSGTVTILAASQFGIPVSTTHCITASVMGAGLIKGLAAVRWGTALNIVIAWVLTLPAAALISFASLFALEAFFGRT